MVKNTERHIARLTALEVERQKRREKRKGAIPVTKNPLVQDNNRTKVFNRQFQV